MAYEWVRGIGRILDENALSNAPLNSDFVGARLEFVVG